MPQKKIPLYQLHETDAKEEGLFVFPFSFSDKAMLSHLIQVSIPHRHDHYCCFFVESGSIDFHIDFQPVKVSKSCLLISYPGQIHQFISHKACRGWALAFDAKLVDENARMVIEESLVKVALLRLDSGENEWFKKLFELIHAAVPATEKSRFRAQLARSLLNSFIYRASEYYERQKQTHVGEYSSRNIEITRKFRQLLQKNFKSMKKPADYAKHMNFSVSYLNDTVKAVTGFPLTYFIQQEVVSEAQRLLYYSEMSIKEIAYELGYEDDKYFIRLFGKSTGSSPAGFRKQKKGRAFKRLNLNAKSAE
jgi:AraC family transcriptional activator of pobA